ncbi:unnamed protein product [Arabis nemorensis]|uniref:F-box protein At3g26010-like beta-propeller domain-containing protein n=1 Tax=Arabis nemorensis TaxID=586526 RepID=A0A565CA92_9BRAS|nr:unnamed protein product [Arabis nemorensis]
MEIYTQICLFRDLFVSLHKNSSSSWSLILAKIWPKEFIGLYGCETWDLPKSPASYISFPSPAFPDLGTGNFAFSASSNGLVLMEGSGYGCYVGNPVLQQWVEIPSCPYKSLWFGFLTRVDEDGVVLSFTVVRVNDTPLTYFHVFMYSSETGIWTSKSLHHLNYTAYSSSPMSLNGMHYFLSQLDVDEPEELIAHDFFSESHHYRAIHFPDRLHHYSRDFKRALTTSRGYLMYIKTLARKRDNSDIGSFAPMAMHPFDSDTVYIWGQQNRCMVSCNLRTQNCKMLGDASKGYNDDVFMNQYNCQGKMDKIYGHHESGYRFGTAVVLSQFVLPRWMESIPCPPNVKMIDTTSLLSYITLVQKTKREKGEGKKVVWVQTE